MQDSSVSYESAAQRVQYWFKKDKVDSWQENECARSPGEFYKRYKCNHVRKPRIPPQVRHLSFHGYLLARKKREVKRRYITRGNPLKPLNVTIDAHAAPFLSENTLTSQRVASCESKEHLFAAKRLKNTSRQHAVAPTKRQVVSLQSRTQQDLASYPHRMESERHFLLCAIPMYPVFKDELKRN